MEEGLLQVLQLLCERCSHPLSPTLHTLPSLPHTFIMRTSCRFVAAGLIDHVVKEEDLLEVLQLLCERLGHPSPQEAYAQYIRAAARSAAVSGAVRAELEQAGPETGAGTEAGVGAGAGSAHAAGMQAGSLRRAGMEAEIQTEAEAVDTDTIAGTASAGLAATLTSPTSPAATASTAAAPTSPAIASPAAASPPAAAPTSPTILATTPISPASSAGAASPAAAPHVPSRRRGTGRAAERLLPLQLGIPPLYPPWLPRGHPLSYVEEGLRHGCNCAVRSTPSHLACQHIVMLWRQM